MKRLLSSALALVCTAGASFAHDFWIQPRAHRASAGELIGLELRVGVEYQGDLVVRNPERLVRFESYVPGRELVHKPVPGRDGYSPAGYFRNEAEGLHLVAFQSNDAALALDAAKFEAYLVEEGLEHISRWRAERGQANAGARELYQRAAKSLLEIGSGSHEGFDRALGLPLEIVPLTDPTAKPVAQQPLRARVLWQGQPLEGALLMCMPRSEPKQTLRQRTDERGEAVFELARSGEWMLKVVWMQPHPEPAAADFQSWWSSLTFEAR